MSFLPTSAEAAIQIIGDAEAPYALIISPVRNLGGIFADVTVEEVHNDRLEITQHPIQTGAVVTDHSFALPATLTMRIGFSDSSAGYVGYVQEQYAAILALQASRQPFSVSTGKRLYDNMLIRELTVETNATAEYVLNAVVGLHQVTFADAGDTSTATAANQMFPQETAPSVNVGLVVPKLWTGALPSSYPRT